MFSGIINIHDFICISIGRVLFDSSVFCINMCLNICYLGNKTSNSLDTGKIKAKHKKQILIKHSGRSTPAIPEHLYGEMECHLVL